MQLKLTIVLFVLALIGADAFRLLCTRTRVRNYKMYILTAARMNSKYELICRALDDFLNKAPCKRTWRRQAIEEMRLRTGRNEVTEGKLIDELRQKLSPIMQICPINVKVPLHMKKCVRSLEEKLSKCFSDAVTEVFLGVPQKDEDKIRCSVYYFVAKCAQHKDENSCVKEADQLALKETDYFLGDIQESCGDLFIAGVLKAYENVEREGKLVFEPKFVPGEIGCDHERAYESKVWIYYISGLERSYEDICAGVSIIRNRLNIYTEKCSRGGEGYEEILELKNKVDTIMQICPGKDRKVPVGMEQCLKSLEEKLRKCVIDKLQEVSYRKEQTEADKIKCSNYQFVAKCVVQKDEDQCGKEPGQIVLINSEEVLYLPDEIQDSCGNAIIKGALNELAYDIKSRRE